jgi:hypothetical protein
MMIMERFTDKCHIKQRSKEGKEASYMDTQENFSGKEIKGIQNKPGG